MKITKVKIKNMFGIKEYELDGKDVELSGKRGSGKTSIIDSIRIALKNKSARDFIIREGQSEGEVIIETDTGLSINRKYRTNKADSKTIKDNGRDVPSPETFLRDIFTELQLNPVEFLAMSKNDQNRMILDLIDFEWDLKWIEKQFGEIVPAVNYEQNILGVLNEIQSEEGYYFTKRQDINREARNKQAFIEEIGAELPKDYNVKTWEDANVGELYRKIEAIQNDNSRIEKAKAVIHGQAEKIKDIDNKCIAEIEEFKNNASHEISDRKSRIKELEKEIEIFKDELREIESGIEKDVIRVKSEHEQEKSDFKAEVKQYEDVAKKDIIDVFELQKEAANVENMKSFINEYKRMVGYQVEVENLKGESETLTGKIELARKLPGHILETSEIPVEGLTIKDGIPLINGLPISNLSDGEKLDLCVNVATQKQNALNIVLVDGVEKLDTENRNKLYASLKEKGVQFVSTRTTDDDDLTVIEL